MELSWSVLLSLHLSLHRKDDIPYFLDWNAHSNTTRPRIQDYRGLLPNLIERALVYNAHLLITDDFYQCLWWCNSFLSK